MIHGPYFIQVRSKTQAEYQTATVLGWEKQKKKKKKGGYLQDFEIMETLENVARNVPQLISRDSPGREIQEWKVRENKILSPYIYDVLCASFKRTGVWWAS